MRDLGAALLSLENMATLASGRQLHRGILPTRWLQRWRWELVVILMKQQAQAVEKAVFMYAKLSVQSSGGRNDATMVGI